jgi:hypothetical protein
MTQTDTKTHERGAGEAFLSAEDLNKYMKQRRMAELAKEEAREREEAKAQAEQIKQLMSPIEVTADEFKERLANFMRRVRNVAEQGEHNILVLRFPSDLCTDRGRAINNALPGWEESLVGVPKQLVQVWEEHLKPLGFRLSAEVLDYPRGVPGDIGLFCRW